LQLVPLGRFKLTWWSAGAPSDLSSVMYSRLEDALADAARLGGPWLIMENVHVGQGSYRWRVLPYGAHRLWSAGATAYELRWLLAAACLVAALQILRRG
jgi:hypothetical protein